MIGANRFKENKSILKNYSAAIITVLVLCISTVFGVLFYKLCNSLFDEELNSLFNNYTNIFINKSKPEILSGLLLGNAVYFILMLLFSTSVIGSAFIYSVSALKITGLGVVVAYLYGQFGLKGIEYCALVIFPGKFFMILSMIILIDSCIYICKNIRKKQAEYTDILKNQIIRVMLVLMFMALSLVLDYITLTVFSDLFQF